MSNNTTKDLIQSVATEINFLRLPIFKTSKSIVEKKTIVLDYSIENDDYHIEISHGGNLTAFDRKILLIIEYLYIQQNPDLVLNKITTNFTEIASILGISHGNAAKIWESLSKLRGVEIKTKIRVKREEKVVNLDSEFNLLFSITRVLSEEKNGKRKYTNSLEVLLNDWHVDNFRNNYYRVVNLGLVAGLRSGIAVRLFDYLNYKAFYYDKELKRYRQKLKIRIAYDGLVKYLHIAKRPGLKEIRKQFKTALQELREKGVIRFVEYEKRPSEIFLILHLARSINWRELKSTEVEILPKKRLEKRSEVEIELDKYGLSANQAKDIIKRYSEAYIKIKIDQLRYLLKFASHKVKGAGRFLYQSIINDWKDDSFVEYLKESKDILRRRKDSERENLMGVYNQYVIENCNKYYESLSENEKEIINKAINEKLNSPFLNKVKSARNLVYEAEKIALIKPKLNLKTFKEFAETAHLVVEAGTLQE